MTLVAAYAIQPAGVVHSAPVTNAAQSVGIILVLAGSCEHRLVQLIVHSQACLCQHCFGTRKLAVVYASLAGEHHWGLQVGLNYICATAERFFAVSAVLCTMVGTSFQEQPSLRLLKHIIRCYLRLSDNGRAREALRQCLPAHLTQQDFHLCLKDDIQTRQYAPYPFPPSLAPGVHFHTLDLSFCEQLSPRQSTLDLFSPPSPVWECLKPVHSP